MSSARTAARHTLAVASRSVRECVVRRPSLNVKTKPRGARGHKEHSTALREARHLPSHTQRQVQHHCFSVQFPPTAQAAPPHVVAQAIHDTERLQGNPKRMDAGSPMPPARWRRGDTASIAADPEMMMMFERV